MAKTLFGDRNRREFFRLAGAGAAALAAPIPVLAQDGKIKMATIGAGREGGALGSLFVKAGHPLMFSSRHPDELTGLVNGLGPLAKAGTAAEAVAFGDVVVLAVPYTAEAGIAREVGPALAQKRLVIDVSNPIPRRDGADFVKSVDVQGGPGLVTQKLLPGAKIVRAFNALGPGTLARRQGDEKIGVPIAGDDPAAIALASRLIREIGFEPVLVGGLAMGRYLVPGTPLAGARTPAQIREIVASLK